MLSALPRPASDGWAGSSRDFEKGCDHSLKVVVKDPEEFEQALREFRRKVQEQGLVREMRRRAHYVPPAEARKIKSLRARRRRSR
jgi:small subunit ribosomal protein S21